MKRARLIVPIVGHIGIDAMGALGYGYLATEEL